MHTYGPCLVSDSVVVLLISDTRPPRSFLLLLCAKTNSTREVSTLEMPLRRRAFFLAPSPLPAPTPAPHACRRGMDLSTLELRRAPAALRRALHSLHSSCFRGTPYRVALQDANRTPAAQLENG